MRSSIHNFRYDVVKGSFYTSCTLDTCRDVIRQHLVYAFYKKKVGSDASQNRLQGPILPLSICAWTLCPKSRGQRCKLGLFSISTVEGTYLQFLPQDWLFLTFCYAIKFSTLFYYVSDVSPFSVVEIFLHSLHINNSKTQRK